MLRGQRVIVRPMRDEDVTFVARWAADPDMAAGPYQRYQLEHGRLLTTLYAKDGLISRQSGFLIIELADTQQAIGFVRYSTTPFPDADIPGIDIGYGIAEPEYRGKGYAGEAVALLVDYLFAGYPVERLSAYTDAENIPSRQLLERLGFTCEGIMRAAMFRNGEWHDMCIYGILRREWRAQKEKTTA